LSARRYIYATLFALCFLHHKLYLMKVLISLLLLFSMIFVKELHAQSANERVEMALQQIKSGDLSAARISIEQLDKYKVGVLAKELDTQAKAKAFWLNLYNATVQLHLQEDPRRFDDRDVFFQKDWIRVAGLDISLDAIEHGIIRRSKNKLSLGYMDKLFVDGFEEKFRLDEVDYRVHFALNCGALSCPPVAIYFTDRLEEQLDKSSKLYLQDQIRLDEKENDLYVPRLCFWFNGDFGGEDGIKEMLKKHGFTDLLLKDPDIEYLEYDWTLKVSNYIEI
jgi:hypothetical protein